MKKQILQSKLTSLRRFIMRVDQTIRVTERVFDLEDYKTTHKSLDNMKESIYQMDRKFLKLFNNLMVDEDQKGKIIDHLGESSAELSRQNLALIHELEERNEEMINELTSKVNSMNQFTMSITYHEKTPTSS